MTLSLNGTLSGSQDQISRHPLIEIISQPSVADIPFDGQFLTSEITNEQKPNSITHSSGRLCLLYNFGATGELKYVYTDVDRTVFNFVSFHPWNTHPILDSCLCELSDGNIGLVYISSSAGNRYLRRMVISVTGQVVSADAQIDVYVDTSYLIDMLFVIRLASGAYLLVYYHKTVTGSVYEIAKRTSSDFLSWSSESMLSIGGIDTSKASRNPSLLQINNGDIFLKFDYVDELNPGGDEITNCYYSISTNDGVDWGSGVKFTNYTTFGVKADHPIAAQKQTNQVHVAFTEKRSALIMDSFDTGSCSTEYLQPGGFSFDVATRMLYVIGVNRYAGFRALQQVMKIDVDNWQIVDCWDCDTVPAFPSYLCEESSQYPPWVIEDTTHSEEHTIAILSQGFHTCYILDGEADTIRNYTFFDVPGVGLTKNVDHSVPDGNVLRYAWVDSVNNKLWVLLVNSYIYTHTSL